MYHECDNLVSWHIVQEKKLLGFEKKKKKNVSCLLTRNCQKAIMLNNITNNMVDI